MRISALMPTFNSEKTIAGAIEAVLESEHIVELLIADGGSTDRTVQIIHQVRDPRVRLLSQQDAGIYDGINRIAHHIGGDHVIFCNSDDEVNPDYLSELSRQASDVDFFFGKISYGGRVVRPRLLKSVRAPRVWQIMPFPHASLVVKTELFLKLMPFDLRFSLAADLDFINRLLAMGHQGRYIDVIASFCRDDGLTSGGRHHGEARNVAIKNGRSALHAYAVYALIRTRFLLSQRRFKDIT
ncbi:MAG: glycosyltransferase [Rubrivivax sp.]|nr:MAG: glycosyltransferase [Rubrivivax sp.]